MSKNKVRYREISPELEKLAALDYNKISSRASVGFEDDVGEFYYFSVDDLIPYKKQARIIFDEEEIEKLSETIKQYGIRQPLSILKSNVEQGKYEVVSGERRLRAAKKAGLDKIPCIVIKNENDADEISLIENIQRQDLHPLELARAINVLMEKTPHGEKAGLGKKMGLSRSQLSELGSLLKFSLGIQSELLDRNVRGREHFRKLHSLKDEESQLCYLNSLILSEDKNMEKFKRKPVSKSIIRLSIVDGTLKVQSYSLNKIDQKEKEDVKRALLDLVDQLGDKNVRGREHPK